MSSYLPDMDLYPVSSLPITGRYHDHQFVTCFISET